MKNRSFLPSCLRSIVRFRTFGTLRFQIKFLLGLRFPAPSLLLFLTLISRHFSSRPAGRPSLRSPPPSHCTSRAEENFLRSTGVNYKTVVLSFLSLSLFPEFQPPRPTQPECKLQFHNESASASAVVSVVVFVVSLIELPTNQSEWLGGRTDGGRTLLHGNPSFPPFVPSCCRRCTWPARRLLHQVTDDMSRRKSQIPSSSSSSAPCGDPPARRFPPKSANFLRNVATTSVGRSVGRGWRHGRRGAARDWKRQFAAAAAAASKLHPRSDKTLEGV